MDILLVMLSWLNHNRLQFAKFQQDFNKEYNTKEDHEHRFQIFQDNLHVINAHNKAGHSYKMGNFLLLLK